MFGWRNEASGARLVEEALLAPVEVSAVSAERGRDRLVGAARRDVARQVLLQRDLEVEVGVGGEVGQAEAADAEQLLDAVFVQLRTRRAGRCVVI